MIKRVLNRSKSRVLLFFPNTPVYLDEKTSEPKWQMAPTSKLFNRLICSLSSEVEQGRVILGAETRPMQAALTQLTGVPFTYFPHPVAVDINAETLKAEIRKFGLQEVQSGNQIPDVGISEFEHSAFGNHPDSDLTSLPPNSQLSTPITMGAYGGARARKRQRSARGCR